MVAKTYAVLVGDIAKSRKVRRRAHLQRRLDQVFEAAAETFGRSIVSGPAITLGDEYQAVFRTGEAAYRAALHFALELRPLKLHQGIGLGRISTSIDADSPGRMDGPAFHHARAAIERSRHHKTWLTFEGLGQADDELVSATLELWGRVRDSWTERQREVVEAVERAPDQKTAARHLRVTPPTVTEVLQAAKYHELNRVKAAVLAFLDCPMAPPRRGP